MSSFHQMVTFYSNVSSGSFILDALKLPCSHKVTLTIVGVAYHNNAPLRTIFYAPPSDMQDNHSVFQTWLQANVQ